MNSKQRIARSAVVMHSAERMYTLVNDVVKYPEFLNGCSRVDLLELTEKCMLARLCVAKAGMNYSLVTRNIMQPGRRIDMQLQEGPFEYLRGSWLFLPLCESACRVEMEINFVFVGGLRGKAAELFLNQMAANVVDAFCQRADKIHGYTQTYQS